VVRAENLPFSPQYPLWSDGAIKRRWLYLPAGATIDASNPDAWVFPPGTRLWKEFAHGRPVETRFIERLRDGSWRYASYVWNADGSDAVLAPAEGIAALSIEGTPRGRYSVPSEADCHACHEGAAVPVLGVGALQLSPDRDSFAPHAEPTSSGHIDLSGLVARGLLRNLPAALLEHPPRVAGTTPAARSALGYLHGNCGHCHNDVGPLASMDMSLAQEVAAAASSARILGSTIGQSSRSRPRGAQPVSQRIVPGKPDASVLALRMRSRNPLTQMPPVGTQFVDVEGLALIEHWIHHELPSQKEITP
jgi:mono/diheme cytochrome c family protein